MNTRRASELHVFHNMHILAATDSGRTESIWHRKNKNTILNIDYIIHTSYSYIISTRTLYMYCSI